MGAFRSQAVREKLSVLMFVQVRSESRAPEHDAQVVRRHGDTLLERKPVPAGERRDLVEIAHAPFSIACAQAFVKGSIARRGMPAMLAERPVEKQHAACR